MSETSTRSARLRWVLADDVDVLSDISHMLLDSLGWVEVCAEASVGAEALDATELLRPDIALLDQRMPHAQDGVGLQLMRERVSALEGQLDIEAPVGSGTNAVIAIPLH